MPPKGQKKRGTVVDKSKAGEERQEDALQALVLTDSYETKFEPFTNDRPRCLLPLANTPLLEYTLEFLAASGVEEVFLYCGNHTEQLEEYIFKSKWSQSTAPFSLEVIRSQSQSIGDAMRDMEQKQKLVGDFICVYGDVVTNINLAPALAEHKARREKDKKAIMTMVLREAGNKHNSHTQRPVFVVDPEKQRCLHYEQLQPGDHTRIDIEGDIFKEHEELEMRADLIDCGIDICSTEVLAQYSDNFDWQMPRRGFLHGILKDYELFQLTVHTHILTQGYAARVRDIQAYTTIRRDVIKRWVYPFGSAKTFDKIELDIVDKAASLVHDLDEDDTASISTLHSDLEDDESVDSHHQRSSRADSFGSVGSTESGVDRHNAADFHHEAASSIFDSLQKGDGADSIQLELKALTLSSNADGKQVRRAVAVAMMKRVANLVEGGAKPKKAVDETLIPNKLLIERAVLDRDAKVKEEQIEFLLFMQADCVHRAQGDMILVFAVSALDDEGLIDTEGLEQWLEDPRSTASEELIQVRKKTEEVFGEEDESSEDEDDDEE